MKLIPLTRGHFAKVSDEDFIWLNEFKWCAYVHKDGRVYARRRKNGKMSDGYKGILMHRLILGLENPKIIGEHRDGDSLNNQRENLRPSTQAENARNTKLFNTSTTGYKGVSLRKDTGVYRAYLVKDYKQINLGFSSCPKTCARTYNQAAIEHFGEFARLNIVEDGPLCEISILNSTNKSGYRGVCFEKTKNRWCCQVGFGGKAVFRKGFDNPIDAAKAYDAKAKELYGDKAKLNFPDNLKTA